MASIASRLSMPSRLPSSLAVRALPGLAAAAMLVSAAQAGELAGPCGNTVSLLNDGQVYDAFDKLNGGGDKRLRFRLDGKEPCPAGGCQPAGNAGIKPDTAPAGGAGSKPPAGAESGAGSRPDSSKPDTQAATKVEIVARAAAAEKVVATVDLTGRTVSYCLNGVRSVDATPAQRRDGCPPRYLVNFLAIKLVDVAGPFARRDVSIQYVYRPEAGTVRLDRCVPPAILDGMFRRRAWTVTLEDGATAYIGEIDFPRDRRAPVPWDAPFATTVAGP
jgi:hypothetical protein